MAYRLQFLIYSQQDIPIKMGARFLTPCRRNAAGKSFWMLLSTLSTPTHHCLRDFLAGKVVLPSYITLAASTLCAVAGTCDNNLAASYRKDGFTTAGGGGIEA